MKREYLVMGRRLEIHLGDITRLEVDAIVSSENSDLLMDHPDGPSVSGAIRRVEGEGMARDLARLGPLEPGRAVVLPARQLPCRWVIHAASVIKTEAGHRSTPTMIREAVRSSLQLAAGLGLASLAFPAFGVRAADVPAAEASQLMVEQIVAGLCERTPLQRVVVALLDPESFLTFFEEAMRRAAAANRPQELQLARRGAELVAAFQGSGPLELEAARPLTSAAFEGVLTRSQRLGPLSTRALQDGPGELRRLGEAVRELLPSPIAEQLDLPGGRPLVLRLDEALDPLPFELLRLSDSACLVERRPVGRLLRSSDPVGEAGRGPAGRHQEAQLALRALIVAAGDRDLPDAVREGRELLDLLWRRAGSRAAITLLGGARATRAAVKDALGQADLVHFCGHAREHEGQPCWALGSEQLELGDLPQRWPARLVVANACGLTPGPRWTRAVLGSGARHYVHARWEVGDALARVFARALYEALALGQALGQALASARNKIREADPLHWAAYVHYGDPVERLFQAGPVPPRE